MPRIFVGTFPAVPILGIGAAPVSIPESRITTTGQRGIVSVWWFMGITKASAAALDLISTGVFGSSPVFNVSTGLGEMSGVIGSRLKLWAYMLLQDPPENGFVEIRPFTTTGSFDLGANQGGFQVMSFPDEAASGPLIRLG